MEKLETKKFIIAAIIVSIMLLFNTCNSCSNKRETIKLQEEVKALKQGIDSISKKQIEKTQTMVQIEGLKTEKRVLINTNDIFLTKTRPDQRYNEIDKEIESLSKK